MPAPSVETMPLMQLMGTVHFAIANTRAIKANIKPEIKWALHVAVRELVRRTSNYSFRKNGYIDITAADVDAGRAIYPLPHDFSQEIEDGVKLLDGDRRTLKFIADSDYDARQLDTATATGEPILYMIRGRNETTGEAEMTFWPTPTYARRVIINFVSFPEPIWKADDGAFLDRRIPVEWHDMLPSGALRHMPRFMSDNDWQKHTALWEGGIREAQKKSMPVIGQTYQREMYDSGGNDMPGLGRAPNTFVGATL